MKAANVRYCQRFAELEKSKLKKIFSTQREFKKSKRRGEGVLRISSGRDDRRSVNGF